MDLNKVMLIGNVTADPEVRTTPTGQNVSSFSVATNAQWTDATGQRQTRAEFHNIVAWRKLADIIGQYVKKGTKVYVEGRLQTRSWEDQAGQKRYKTEINAENLILLSSRPTTGAAPAAAMAGAPIAMSTTPSEAMSLVEEDIQIEEAPNLENIPF